MSGLTHFDQKGDAHMVDVSQKAVTERVAVARGRVTMNPETFAILTAGSAKKGDVLGVARLAGIMGAKQTSALIPLCHPLPITKVALDLQPTPASAPDRPGINRPGVTITATVKTTGKTGIEMEALTAVSVAALTVYDMLKAVEKTMVISDIHLVMKDGGKTGRFEAE